MSQAKKWPIKRCVEIEFTDACTSGGWMALERQRKETGTSLCRSIGFLVDATADHVTVAQSISQTTENVSDTMSIPRAAIRRMITVKGLR